MKKTTLLKKLVQSPELSFLMEAHNGLSAKIVEEVGFEAIWASGLSISAALGVRDSNEASWTQTLEILEFMSDATSIPILLDGDTGYGNFNNIRRLIQKLEQRSIAGVCIEDKSFPKTNSFLDGRSQSLAEIDEFCGRISAGKDSQKDEDFVIVARTEALVAGWGLKEALKRAEAYRKAGADAILIHSAQPLSDEVVAFKKEWGARLPVIIIPTKYFSTATGVFRQHGFSAIIWANHLMRSCITAMQKTARQIFTEQTLVNVEALIAPLSEVFRLQGVAELTTAEKRYLPKNNSTRAVILATPRGADSRDAQPSCMRHISGEPVLSHLADIYREAGIKEISVVRGCQKDAVNVDGLSYFDNDEAAFTSELYSLYLARQALEGTCIISYGNVLFKKHLLREMIDLAADFVVAVDATWRDSRGTDRPAAYATCSEVNSRKSFYNAITLVDISSEMEDSKIHGEWTGLLKVTDEGTRFLRWLLDDLAHQDMEMLKSVDMAALLRKIIQLGKEVRVIYTVGNWLDVGSADEGVQGRLPNDSR